MKTIKLLLVTLACLGTITCYAQTAALKPLNIGDKMPEMDFGPTINYKKPAFNIADYSNKLVIIDFWATWCHWCIAEFPKEDSLSLKFGNKLQFMLVDIKADDTTATLVKNFYAKRMKSDKRFKLPSVYMDTQMVKLFPHRIMPHYVWIRDGVIIAITGAEQIKASNIQAAIDGKAINLPQKTM